MIDFESVSRKASVVAAEIAKLQLIMPKLPDGFVSDKAAVKLKKDSLGRFTGKVDIVLGPITYYDIDQDALKQLTGIVNAVFGPTKNLKIMEV